MSVNASYCYHKGIKKPIYFFKHSQRTTIMSQRYRKQYFVLRCINKKKLNRYLTVSYLLKFVFHGTLGASTDRSQRQEGKYFVKSICLSFCNMTNLIFSCLMVLSVQRRKRKNIQFINGISIRAAMKENVKNCYTLSTVQDWEFSQALSSCNLLIYCICMVEKAYLMEELHEFN